MLRDKGGHFSREMMALVSKIPVLIVASVIRKAPRTAFVNRFCLATHEPRSSAPTTAAQWALFGDGSQHSQTGLLLPSHARHSLAQGFRQFTSAGDGNREAVSISRCLYPRKFRRRSPRRNGAGTKRCENDRGDPAVLLGWIRLSRIGRGRKSALLSVCDLVVFIGHRLYGP